MIRHLSGSLRFILTGIVVALLALAPVSAQEMHLAGLVVDYGDGRVSYVVVPFDEDEINGVELLQRSGLDIVTVGFGGLGDAVCQVDDTGCSVDDCRTRMCQTSDPESPFWQFSKLQADEWTFVATGASGAKVVDGDIYAWSWTGVDPDLPVMTMEELAERAGGDPLAQDPPTAMLRTEGGETDRGDDEDGLEPLTIAGLAAVVVVAGLLVLRGMRASSKVSLNER